MTTASFFYLDLDLFLFRIPPALPGERCQHPLPVPGAARPPAPGAGAGAGAPAGRAYEETLQGTAEKQVLAGS